MVYSSNIFAIIGLRALYTLRGSAVDFVNIPKTRRLRRFSFHRVEDDRRVLRLPPVDRFLALCRQVVVGARCAGLLCGAAAEKRKDDKDDGMLQYPHGEPPSPLYQQGHRNGSARSDLIVA